MKNNKSWPIPIVHFPMVVASNHLSFPLVNCPSLLVSTWGLCLAHRAGSLGAASKHQLCGEWRELLEARGAQQCLGHAPNHPVVIGPWLSIETEKSRRLGIPHGLGTTKKMVGVFFWHLKLSWILRSMRSTLWEAVKDNYPSEIWGDLVCWGMDMVNKHMGNPICNGMQESPFFFWWCFLSIPPNGSKCFFLSGGVSCMALEMSHIPK